MIRAAAPVPRAAQGMAVAGVSALLAATAPA